MLVCCETQAGVGVCVCVVLHLPRENLSHNCEYMPAILHVRMCQRTICGSWFSPTPVVIGIELRLGLAAGTITS